MNKAIEKGEVPLGRMDAILTGSHLMARVQIYLLMNVVTAQLECAI